MKGVALALLILCIADASLFAQSQPSSGGTSSSTGSTSSTGTGGTSSSTGSSSSSGSSSTGQPAGSGQQAQSNEPQPVPYSPDEFPAWMRQLRRGEVIAIGAFPIALLFSSLGYQLARYAQNGFAQAYAPAIFGATATPLTNKEKIGVVLGGVGLAIVVALIDFTLGKIQGSK